MSPAVNKLEMMAEEDLRRFLKSFDKWRPTVGNDTIYNDYYLDTTTEEPYLRTVAPKAEIPIEIIFAVIMLIIVMLCRFRKRGQLKDAKFGKKTSSYIPKLGLSITLKKWQQYFSKRFQYLLVGSRRVEKGYRYVIGNWRGLTRPDLKFCQGCQPRNELV